MRIDSSTGSATRTARIQSRDCFESESNFWCTRLPPFGSVLEGYRGVLQSGVQLRSRLIEGLLWRTLASLG